MYGNVFHQSNKTYESNSRPVWLDVKERKIAGGIKEAGALVAGSVIKAGTPVQLNAMGGELVVLEQFLVLADSTGAAGQTLSLKVGSFGTEPASGLIMGKMNDEGVIATAGSLGTATKVTDGVYNVDIASDLGALVAGDVLTVASAEGTNVQVEFKPTGLTWHDAYIVEGTSHWTAAVVTKGQILEDAIPVIPAFIKSQLVGITFEKEL